MGHHVQGQIRTLSEPAAVLSCTAMALFYVAVLHVPTLVLRLPAPASFHDFMIRRFVCAAVSSVASLAFCAALILPVSGANGVRYSLSIYGIRLDYIWEAVVFPLALTSLMYAGSLVLKLLTVLESLKEHINDVGGFSFECIRDGFDEFVEVIRSAATNIMVWRNLVVAPLTEELVFRACMIPLLLCGGFGVYSVIFFCPVLFSLAHLNHWMEIYSRHKSFLKASMVIGLQLGYTVIFGLYASFLYIRTGHLLAPLVAHIFCNFMGLPVLFAGRKGVVTLAFVAGVAAFVWLLFPLTRPELYNNRTDDCRCWHGYCSWNSSL